MNRLSGRSVLITRPKERGASLAVALEKLGALVAHRPTIRFEPMWNRAEILEMFQNLDRFRWVVLTSPTAAGYFLQAARVAGARPESAWFAVPGEGTAAVLRAGGVEPRLVARKAYAAALASELADQGLQEIQVLWPRPETVRPVLPEILRRAGAHLTEQVLYRTVPTGECREILEDVLQGRYDAVLFSSPSSFRSLFEGGVASPADLPSGLRFVAIGEVTAAAIRKAGGQVDQVADPPGEEGILAAMQEAFSP